MNYQRPLVHVYADATIAIFEVNVRVPLEFDYDSISVNSSFVDGGVEMSILLEDADSANIHVEKIGPETFSFSLMVSLKVVVLDGAGNVVGI